jgi:xylulokinase
MTNWLAIDIGTTGAKAALIAPDGTIHQSAYREYATHSGADGVVEQNAANWWGAVVDICRELNAPVDAITLTGQMQDVILVDAAGESVRPAILYSDTRAREQAEAINAQFDGEALRQRIGTRPDAGGLLAKLMWLAQHEPNLHAEHLLLGAADFIAFKMTGNAASDTTTASTTGLMDLSQRQPHADDLFATLGIDHLARLLPPMQPGGAQTGTLTAGAAESLGLPAGIPVHLGPGDAGAATLGAGAGEPGQVYGYLGTSGWIAFTASGLAENPGVITLAHPQPNHTIQVAPLLTAGGNLEWARDLFADADYSRLIETAAAQPPSNLLYLPYLNGERSPFQDPLARGAFIGLSATTSKPDLYRAVLEGVIYAYRHALDALLTTSVDRLTLTGGGTRTGAWCQLFADILNVPVAVVADAANVGARGALLAARIAAGEIETYAPADFIAIEQTFHPAKLTQREVYDQKYALFREAYPALKSIFSQM